MCLARRAQSEQTLQVTPVTDFAMAGGEKIDAVGTSGQPEAVVVTTDPTIRRVHCKVLDDECHACSQPCT